METMLVKTNKKPLVCYKSSKDIEWVVVPKSQNINFGSFDKITIPIPSPITSPSDKSDESIQSEKADETSSLCLSTQSSLSTISYLSDYQTDSGCHFSSVYSDFYVRVGHESHLVSKYFENEYSGKTQENIQLYEEEGINLLGQSLWSEISCVTPHFYTFI